MNRYFFVLGRAQALCQAELAAVLAPYRPKTEVLSPEIVSVETSQPLDVNSLQNTLGGVVKIGEFVSATSNLSAKDFCNFIKKIQVATKRIFFGLSFYSLPPVDPIKLTQEIKDELKGVNIVSRYFLPTQGHILSSVVVFKSGLIEFMIFHKKETGWLIAKTVSVQDVDSWSKRDYQRPYVSPKTGMLPLKVARMMVNLALSSVLKEMSPMPISSTGGQGPTLILLDPFCGMGTILGEALLLGCKVIGGDQSDDAVHKAESNLEWLISIYRYIEKIDWKLINGDATHISEKLDAESIDTIVTEPFMGALFSREAESGFAREKGDSVLYQRGKKVTLKNIHNTLRGLEKLYLGAFKNWRSILRPHGVVVMAFPEIVFAGHMYRVKNMESKLIEK